MLDTYAPKRPYIVCPKCKKKGFLTERWVRGSPYFVKGATIHELSPIFDRLDFIRVYKYTGRDYTHNDYHHRYDYVCVDRLTGENHYCSLQANEGSTVRVPKRIIEVLPHRKTMHYYIGHYDSKKYKEQMQRFRDGKIKSRPNGRRWCSVNSGELKIPHYEKQKQIFLESMFIPA